MSRRALAAAAELSLPKGYERVPFDTNAAQSPSPYYLRLLLRLACLRFALRSSLRARLARFGNISRNGFGTIAR